MAFPWATAISGAQAGGMILGPILSNINSRNENRWNRDWQEEMFRLENQTNIDNWKMQNEYMEGMWNKQNAYNERMWQLQNDYNSPLSVMQRYREAGLNPNLIYGQMPQGSPVTAANFGKSDIKGSSIPGGSGAPVREIDFGGAFGALLQGRKLQVETNNLERMNEILAQKAIGAAMDNTLKAKDSSMKDIQLDNMSKYSSDLMGAQLEKIRQDTNESMGRLSNTWFQQDLAKDKWQTEKKAIEARIEETKGRQALLSVQAEIAKLDLELTRLGFDKSSPWYLKAVGRILNRYAPGAAATLDKAIEDEK